MSEKRAAFFVSGEGSTMQPVVESMLAGKIPGIEFGGLIASKRNIPAIERVQNLGISPDKIIVPDEDGKLDIIGGLEELDAGIGVFMGWDKWISNKVLEHLDIGLATHPGPLPETRKGYGLVPYKTMQEFTKLAGRNEGTEVVVQRLLSKRGWDEGPIVGRRRIPMVAGEPVEVLQKRGKFHESALMEEVLRRYARLGELPEEEQVAYFMRDGEEMLIAQADSRAREFVKSISN